MVGEYIETDPFNEADSEPLSQLLARPLDGRLWPIAIPTVRVKLVRAASTKAAAPEIERNDFHSLVF
jgi:hypothetical protein